MTKGERLYSISNKCYFFSNILFFIWMVFTLLEMHGLFYDYLILAWTVGYSFTYCVWYMREPSRYIMLIGLGNFALVLGVLTKILMELYEKF